MGRIFAAAWLFLFMAGSAMAADNCSVPNIRTLDNQTVDGYMTVRTGTRCFIWMSYSAGAISSAHIVARPAHGTLGIDGTNRIVYSRGAAISAATALPMPARGSIRVTI